MVLINDYFRTGWKSQTHFSYWRGHTRTQEEEDTVLRWEEGHKDSYRAKQKDIGKKKGIVLQWEQGHKYRDTATHKYVGKNKDTVLR